LVPGVAGFHAFRTTATGKVSDPGTDLGTFGGNSSFSQSINDAGQVTGLSEITPGNTNLYRAFRTTPTGTLADPGADLGTLGGPVSAGRAINSRGVVVGESDTAAGPRHAFIYDTQMRDLNLLIPRGTGWELIRAYGINDAGQITGWGTINGQEHAYLLTPVAVPEPGGFGLVGGALVGAWLARRRARTPVCG
jgi:probable HAF family extracellular repeat protein